MSTPVRRQYLQLKRQYPHTILFFRMGDFYEAFDEDAHTIVRELNLVLTARESGKGNKVPMAGVPHHAADNYIARLVQAGYKVAICEQVGKEAVNGLMPREVVRVVTPGTVVEPSLLAAKQNNYLAGLAFSADGKRAGLAHVDITTGKFAVTMLSGEDLPRLVSDELARIAPAELVVSDAQPPLNVDYHLTPLESWRFEPGKAAQTLQDHFQVATLDGFGLAGKTPAIQAAGAVLQYLAQTQKGTLPQIGGLTLYSTDNFMVLDSHTRRNLELTHTLRGHTGKGSLIDVLDSTVTPMGGRLLRNWLQQPLLNLETLIARQDAVEAFAANAPLRAELRPILNTIADLERLTSRILQGIATPRNLADLRQSLRQLPGLKQVLQSTDSPPILALADALDECDAVKTLLEQALTAEPPAQLSKGGVIRPDFSPELQALLDGSQDARRWIADLEATEQQRTGLKVKVGFNKVFGYYLEITKAVLAQNPAPANYIRKQTLVNAERFITPELKDYETRLLNAEERQIEIETRIFQEVTGQIAAHHPALYQSADTLAHLDVYLSLADVAVKNNYVRPTLTTDGVLDIVDGRHPVVEQSLQSANVGNFVPNDTHMSADDLIWIITGPNMSGKSTLLRQVALIVLMAQIGSFVPAGRATVGLTDRIFTRIGAQDEIHAGQSTFMVEMVETAALLAQCTPRSLLILDEIGRGTSTYDGLAIARAIVEYIHNNPRLQAKTLFATHYHELVALENYLPHVKNYNVAVAEEHGQVIFLHKIVPGGADKSYGVHVAQLAGIPRPVINRANEILADLENHADPANNRPDHSAPQQLSFLGPETHPVVEALQGLKIEEMSPLEALNKLYELQQLAAKK